MRPTWLVLGLVVAAGTVAYVKLRGSDGPDGQGKTAKREGPAEQGGDKPISLQRPDKPPAAPVDVRPGGQPPGDGSDPLEARARALLQQMAEAKEQHQAARVQELVDTMRKEAWDAPSARDFAVRAGWNEIQAAEGLSGVEKVRALDRGRRLLTRGAYAPQAFSADGSPRPERRTLIDAIQRANVQVMRYGPGLPSVTESFAVPEGWAPVQIVSRQKLPYGHNALLFWNQGGNLDPRRLRAGEKILLPQEELTIEVHTDRRLLAVMIGDWFVKEFRVGVGKDETPTPKGTFRVDPKHENPDWHSRNGVIPFGDPRNELGIAWIPIVNEEHPKSYGIHGTNRPETVGSACSEGCVRLSNDDVREVFWWVRSSNEGGLATRVIIR